MKKILIFWGLMAFAGSQLCAQDISNTTWKAYVAQISDTITFKIGVNEDMITASNGDTLAHARVKFSQDTVRFSDIDGRYACVGQEGIYTYKVKGDTLNLTLISDACEARTSVPDIVWIRFQGAEPAKKP